MLLTKVNKVGRRNDAGIQVFVAPWASIPDSHVATRRTNCLLAPHRAGNRRLIGASHYITVYSFLPWGTYPRVSAFCCLRNQTTATTSLLSFLPPPPIRRFVAQHSLRTAPPTSLKPKRLLSDFPLISVPQVPMENQWAVPPIDPQRQHVVQNFCLLPLQVLISVPRSPDPTHRRNSRSRIPTKHAYVPTRRRSYLPELLLCAVFCCAAHSNWTTDLVPR
jgi:hypothetical protein